MIRHGDELSVCGAFECSNLAPRIDMAAFEFLSRFRRRGRMGKTTLFALVAVFSLLVCAGMATPAADTGFSFYDFMQGEWEVVKSVTSLKTGSEPVVSELKGNGACVFLRALCSERDFCFLGEFDPGLLLDLEMAIQDGRVGFLFPDVIRHVLNIPFSCLYSHCLISVVIFALLIQGI